MLLTNLSLDPGEKIIRAVRKHWIMFLGPTIFTFLAFVLPPIGFLAVGVFLPDPVFDTVLKYFSFILFGYSLWLLLTWVFFFIQWTNYYLDVWYITDKRIIEINQKGIFHREVSNLRFDKIQDISVEVRGIIATFLKFGHLRVQTAAEDSRSFVMESAYHPEEVRRIIFDLHNKEAEKFTRPIKPL